MTTSLPWFAITSRVAAGLLGGYAFVWGFAALVVALSLAQGIDFHDSMHLGYLLAFLVFLGVFLWAFAADSLARVWLVLVGGGALMTTTAWLLKPTLA